MRAFSPAQPPCSRPAALLGGGGVSYLPETLAYQSRIEAEGETLDEQALASINEVFAAATDNGAVVGNGWLFGSDFNRASREIVVNLADSKPNLIPIGTLNASTANSRAMLGIRTDAINQGYITSDSSGLFTINEDYSVLIMCQYRGDPDDSSAWGRQTATNIFSQSTTTGATGNWGVAGSIIGGEQWTEWGTGGTSFGSAAGSQGREANISPMFMWATFTSAGAVKIYHAGDGTVHKSTPFAGNPTGKPFRVGAIHTASYVAGDLGVAAIIRFDGVLDDTKRADIFNRVYSAWLNHGDSVHVTGNSVTIPASVTGVTSTMRAWAKNLQGWGCYNSAFVNRKAQGAMRLPKFTPTGYTLHPSASADADIATSPINDFAWFKPTIWINDENQNWCSYSGGQPWTAWKHAHDAIASYLQTLQPDLRVVVGTQMPMNAVSIPYSGPFVYADFASAPGRSNLRVISAAIRAETEWTVPKTVVAELYGTGNLGWDVGDDGNAPDPINDHPKGNPLYFPSNDAQHPNDTGHVDWMWGLVYLPGLIAARNPIVTTQPNNKSVSEGLTATFDIAVLGTTETFQWEINTGSGWSTISGATSDSYTTGTLSLGNSGWLYRCKIDNAVGTTYSRIASLTVTLGPTGIGSASIGSTFIIG